MTPEAADYLRLAREHLADARSIMRLPLPHVAAREAYLASYHAAAALIHDRTGRIAKTHAGVRTEFSRLAKNEPRIDRTFSRFLANSYALKSAADYGSDPAGSASIDVATATIDTAERFIESITRVIG